MFWAGRHGTTDLKIKLHSKNTMHTAEVELKSIYFWKSAKLKIKRAYNQEKQCTSSWNKMHVWKHFKKY